MVNTDNVLHPAKTGPWAYRVNGLFVATKKFNGRPFYSMVRQEGMEISLFFDNDGRWRIKISEQSGDEGFAETKRAYLTRPYGIDCAWKLKFNHLGESGMQSAPQLRAIPLDQGETDFRKVGRNCYHDHK